MNTLEDTIAAIATPLGEGGISVIRVSGKSAIEIVDKIFSGKKPLSRVATHTANFGKIKYETGNILDEVVATVFLAPNSYTGENIVEISSHGGYYVSKNILTLLISNGVRIAEPGEFTLRAFISGKIDLSQAEAVADLIHSRSSLSHKSSISQLSGELSANYKKIREKLLDFCGKLELELDFVEDGYKFTNGASLEQELSTIISTVSGLINSYSVGRFFKDGIRVVITGKPNVGKSSLLNSLLQKNRAIVTDIPGTTRDVIEDEIVVDGAIIRFVDTAGIRHSADIVESEGIKKSFEQVETADVVVNLFDEIGEIIQKFELINNIQNAKLNIYVLNKIDLLKEKDKEKEKLEEQIPEKIQLVSAKKNIGIQELLQLILNVTIYSGKNIVSERAVTNERHKLLLEEALNNLISARSTLLENKTSELISLDIRLAINSLSMITGEITNEEILNNIFSKFCIGK